MSSFLPALFITKQERKERLLPLGYYCVESYNKNIKTSINILQKNALCKYRKIQKRVG